MNDQRQKVSRLFHNKPLEEKASQMEKQIVFIVKKNRAQYMAVEIECREIPIACR